MPEIFGAALMGGGSGSAFAVIDVSYPEGAACTCSNGVRTMQAKDTSGHWMFQIPRAGEWTVTISDGDKIRSTNLEVNENKAYFVELMFSLVLFDNGEDNTEITGGWTSITQNKLKLDHTDGDPYKESYKDLTTNNAVDLSGYNTLNFHVVSAYNRYHADVGTSNSKANNSSSMTAYKEIPSNKQVTDETISVDISKINSAYIKLCVGSYNDRNCNITVDKVWAVK